MELRKMRAIFSSVAVIFLVLLASSVKTEESEEPECFTTEWAKELIPCIAHRFIDLLDPNNTETSSMFERNLGGPWTYHETPTPKQKSRMYSSFNSVYNFHSDIKTQLAQKLSTMRPHTMAEKHRLEVMRKIQKIDLDAVFDHAVDQSVAATITARQTAEIMLQAGVQAGVISDVGTLDLSDGELELICAVAPHIIPGLTNPLCKVGIRILECLNKYSDTEYEQSLKWAKCLFECEDLPYMSQCMVDKFDGCGLSWPLRDLSWLGSIIVRALVDYLEMDTCVFQFEQPMNLTETLELEEGGAPTTVVFRNYLHPTVHCIDLGMLGSPIGIVGGLLMWIRGEIGECDTKIEISTYNYMNALLSLRIFFIEGFPVNNFDLGMPKCRSGAVIKQAVIGWHEHAINETGIIHLNTSNWNDTFHIPVMAVIDGKNDGDFTGDLTIKLRAGTNIRANVKIPMVVRDTDVLGWSVDGVTMCTVVNDPHMVTFDQFYYSNHHEGHFYLYKHMEMDYSIQGVFQRCDQSASATCLCAVSVNVGNDVFVVDQCRRKNDTNEDYMKRVHMYVTGDVHLGFQVLRKDEGARFEVVLPGGTYARILTIERHLNLWIRPSVADYNVTQGLCGTFNKDSSDDLTMPDGTVYTGEGSNERGQPKPFNIAWRVPEDEITFLGVERSEDVLVHESSSCSCMYVVLQGVTCTCSGGHLVETCDIIDENTEELTPEIAKISSASPKQISKENGFVYHVDLDIDLNYDPPVFDWSWLPSNPYNERRASEACLDKEENDGMLKECRVMFGRLFPRRPFEKDRYGCIDDIMITGTLNWTSTFKESAKERCREYLYPRINMGTWEYEEFENATSTCLLDCSGRGLCIQGACHCNGSFTGTACEHDASLTPMLQPVTQLCDVRMENCSYIKLFGWNLLPKYDLNCTFTPLQVEAGGMPAEGDTFHVEASYITSHQVACALPEKSASYEVDLVGNTRVSVSRRARSTKLKFMSFDSVCFACNPTGECQRRESKDHCLIQKHCFAAWESDPDENCSVCIPHQLSEDWSLRPTEECQKKYDEWVEEEEQAMRTKTIRIVIASVLSGTVAISAVILFACIGTMKREQDQLKEEYSKKAREIAKVNASVMKSVDSGVSVGTDLNMIETSAYGYSSESPGTSESPSTSVNVRPDDYEGLDQDDARSDNTYSEVKL